MLEECRLPYAVHSVDSGCAGPITTAFLPIAPGDEIPALVDSNGPDGRPIALFESGAILLYLAGKTGRFMPRSVRARYEMLQWLTLPMDDIGSRLDLLDRRLSHTGAFLAGRQYSIADMSVFPWLRSFASEAIDRAGATQFKRWYKAVEARPAVQRALRVLADR